MFKPIVRLSIFAAIACIPVRPKPLYRLEKDEALSFLRLQEEDTLRPRRLERAWRLNNREVRMLKVPSPSKKHNALAGSYYEIGSRSIVTGMALSHRLHSPCSSGFGSCGHAIRWDVQTVQKLEYVPLEKYPILLYQEYRSG